MKRVFVYKNSIITFALILLIIGAIFLHHLYNSLSDFEKNDIDNYITNVTINLKNKEYLNSYMNDEIINNKFEKDISKLDAFVNVFKDGNITYLKVDNNVYELLSDNNKLGTLTLKEDKEESILGLLNYTPIEVANITFNDGIYDVKIKANSTYKVYVNDVLLNDENIVDKVHYSELESLYDNENIPQIINYEVNNLLKKPTINIYNSLGELVTYQKSNNIIDATKINAYDSYDEAKKYIKDDFNPLEIAKNWSLYLTADLNGRNGFYTLKPYLLKGTDLYTRAYNWSIYYDINFTSPHTLSDNPFTDVEMNNFKMYSNDFFTVDIKLTKNMILSNGVKKTDTLNETFYFLYKYGHYKMIDMRTIKE